MTIPSAGRAFASSWMEEDLCVVGEASNGVELLWLLEQLHPGPDVALVDTRMPEMDGVEVTRRIRERFPDVRVVILSAFDDRDLVLSAVEAGARGYVLKDRSAADLVQAIRLVVDGQLVVDPHLTDGRQGSLADRPSHIHEHS
jgi:DNA-binding NarL/FixJ family response regulator